MSSSASRNLKKLLSALKKKSPAAVALSGGVDSSVVAKAAILSSPNSVAVTIVDPSVSKRQFESAVKIAGEIGIRHIIVGRKLPEEVRRNDGMRCYYCKASIVKILKEVAREEGIDVIADGSNFDDLKDSRAGMRACREGGVYSPLLELGFGKKEVRPLAHKLGLPNYNAPSEACLSSRVMGWGIDDETLRRVDKAEEFIRKLTRIERVRVRDYGKTARIEVEREDISRLVRGNNAGRINKRLNKLGYRYVTVDLGGYRVGGL
jgi:uncharacterized protein